MNKEQLEQMPMSELEQYIQSHPYGQYYKYMTAWYVYARRLLNGNGCPKDPGKALDYFEELAAAQHNSAALQAGKCYYQGIGTSSDYHEALKYFEQVSNWPDYTSREGHLWKGKCLLKMKNREQEAVNCFKQVMQGIKTAKQIQYAKLKVKNEAQYLLGVCYYYGIGVKENKETAVQHLKKAALGNDANLTAQYYLAHCYQNGIGTEVNLERAEHWRSMCFEQNCKKLVDEMKEVLGITLKDICKER